jgi:hypothetical protein
MRTSTFFFLSLAACASAEPRPVPPSAPAVASSTPPAATPLPAPSASASAAPAIPPAIAELQRTALASSHAFAIVRSLTDEVGARSAGSAGDRAAVAWAQRTLAANGFANVHLEKVKVAHWERGVETASIVVGGIVRPLAVTALGGSTATPTRGIEAEVVEVDSLAALRALDKGRVAGKIVFVNVPTRRTRTGQGYGESVPVRFSSAEIAKPLGAVAVVIRSIGTDHDRLAHTGAEARDVKGIPAAALANSDADLLHRAIAENASLKLHLTLGPKWLPDAESANVVGEIIGREKPDEVVVMGAHLDSWDLGTGALDDGAGVGIVIDAARLVGAMATRPKRTLRVVLFADEENGREGGDEYARAHAADLPKIVAACEADMGADRAYAARYLGAPEQRPAFAAMAAWLAPLGIEPDMSDAHGGTDVAPLRSLGVPVFDLAQDASRYFDYHHTANDTLDKIDEAQIAQVTAAFASLAYAVADMDGDLGRIPQEKRKGRW